uniref:Uncharacterized protein n=1 Tax=Anopheles minimus TaxID=112268 RepID=A0A182WNI4_9DIPT
CLVGALPALAQTRTRASGGRKKNDCKWCTNRTESPLELNEFGRFWSSVAGTGWHFIVADE